MNFARWGSLPPTETAILGCSSSSCWMRMLTPYVALSLSTDPLVPMIALPVQIAWAMSLGVKSLWVWWDLRNIRRSIVLCSSDLGGGAVKPFVSLLSVMKKPCSKWPEIGVRRLLL